MLRYMFQKSDRFYRAYVALVGFLYGDTANLVLWARTELKTLMLRIPLEPMLVYQERVGHPLW
jgi:hypothetical protein